MNGDERVDIVAVVRDLVNEAADTWSPVIYQRGPSLVPLPITPNSMPIASTSMQTASETPAPVNTPNSTQTLKTRTAMPVVSTSMQTPSETATPADIPKTRTADITSRATSARTPAPGGVAWIANVLLVTASQIFGFCQIILSCFFGV